MAVLSTAAAQAEGHLADVSPVAHLVLDAQGCLESANACARSLLHLDPADAGRPLEASGAGALAAALRPLVAHAHASREAAMRAAVECRMPSGEMRLLDIVAVPHEDAAGAKLGTGIALLDTAASDRALEAANEELAAANDLLARLNEDLERANEALRRRAEGAAARRK